MSQRLRPRQPLPLQGATCPNLPGSPDPSVFESHMLLAQPLQHGVGVRPTQWTPDTQSGEGWATACSSDAHASSVWLPSVPLSVWQAAALSCWKGEPGALLHPRASSHPCHQRVPTTEPGTGTRSGTLSMATTPNSGNSRPQRQV